MSDWRNIICSISKLPPKFTNKGIDRTSNPQSTSRFLSWTTQNQVFLRRKNLDYLELFNQTVETGHHNPQTQ